MSKRTLISEGNPYDRNCEIVYDSASVPQRAERLTVQEAQEVAAVGSEYFIEGTNWTWSAAIEAAPEYKN